MGNVDIHIRQLPSIIAKPSREHGHTLARLWSLDYIGDLDRYFDELRFESKQSMEEHDVLGKRRKAKIPTRSQRRVNTYDWQEKNRVTGNLEWITRNSVDKAIDDEFITARFSSTALQHRCNRTVVALKSKSFEDVVFSDEQYAIDQAVYALKLSLATRKVRDLDHLAIYYSRPFKSQDSAARYMGISVKRLERLIKLIIDCYFSLATKLHLQSEGKIGNF